MTTSEVSEDKMDVLFTAEEISVRVREMGAEITRFYKDKPLTVIVLASGGIFFGADIMRAIDLPIWVDCLGVASYINDKSSGQIKCRSQLKLDCSGRHVLLVDEVLDTGKTLFEVRKMLLEQGALSVKSAVIVTKEVDRSRTVAEADWTGFRCPDRYLVGYGLDSNEEYRNLPFIGALD
ncbi:MAG: hypoxanthine phosphoribosyltransferase [Lentisphaeria bacterium]|nr:hypoxanthine phosphoribosyltransferase [Lentisphaeria bacterium]